MRILYFAWLKERTGTAAETVSPPGDVNTVGALIDWLKTRSPGHADAFADLNVVRSAVNQEFADPSDAVAADDEVAFFPPVTGG